MLQQRDLRKPREQVFTGNPTPPAYLTFEAGGVMPDAMRAEFAAALKQQRPDLLPPLIPQWLEQKLRDRVATSVIFVPNGEYVTREPLPGEQENPTADAVSGTLQLKVPKTAWHRYSATGEMLGIAPETDTWQQLYNPQLTSLSMSAKSQGLVADISGRYLLWRKVAANGMGGEAISAWDYDGTPLSVDQPLLEDRSFSRYWDATTLIKAHMGVVDFRY
jgi:hypothetical protein